MTGCSLILSTTFNCFVHDVPLCLQGIADFYVEITISAVATQIEAIRLAAGAEDLEAIVAQVLQIDSDTKATPLKALQGMVCGWL